MKATITVTVDDLEELIEQAIEDNLDLNSLGEDGASVYEVETIVARQQPVGHLTFDVVVSAVHVEGKFASNDELAEVLADTAESLSIEPMLTVA